jgi:hypothetical protein
MRRLLIAILGSLAFGSGSSQAQQTGVVINSGTGAVTALTFPASQEPGAARDRQAPTAPGTATLRGRVYAADSGQPLRRAQVRITSTGPSANGQPPENRLTTTDMNGGYEFAAVRAGRYNLNAQKGSYIGLQWGQQRPNEPGKPIDVLDAQTIEKLDFALPRGAVITGRILDEFGEPVSDAQVAAMRPQNVGGTRRLVNAGRPSTTNDIGEFRLFALPPGEYYVSATLRNLNPLAETDDRSGYAPTYYPATADVSAAQKLPVAIGQTISDITLSLLPTRTSRVTGTAVDSQNRPLRGVVQAVMRSTMLGGPFGISPGQIRPDGSFTINGLTPGDYTLEVSPQGGPGGFSDPEYASTDVTVGGGDVNGIRLVAAKPSAVAGRIVIGSGDGKSLSASTIRIAVTPVPTGGIFFGPFPQPAAINDDWTFQAKARPGLMRISAQGLQAPWNVKAVRYRGTDVSDTGFEVKPNEDLNDIEIELTNRTTEISGTVTNTRGEAVKDYWAILFSRDRDKWKPPSRSVRISRPDQDGRFKVIGLPPGEYLALADNAIDPSDATDPDFLDRIQIRATRFSLGEGETKALDLKLSSSQ